MPSRRGLVRLGFGDAGNLESLLAILVEAKLASDWLCDPRLDPR